MSGTASKKNDCVWCNHEVMRDGHNYCDYFNDKIGMEGYQPIGWKHLAKRHQVRCIGFAVAPHMVESWERDFGR